MKLNKHSSGGIGSLARAFAPDYLVVLSDPTQMAFPLQKSPFVSVSNDNQRVIGLMDVQVAGQSLDYLGKSTAGELYWNNSTVSLGVACGSSVSYSFPCSMCVSCNSRWESVV